MSVDKYFFYQNFQGVGPLPKLKKKTKIGEGREIQLKHLSCGTGLIIQIMCGGGGDFLFPKFKMTLLLGCLTDFYLIWVHFAGLVMQSSYFKI